MMVVRIGAQYARHREIENSNKESSSGTPIDALCIAVAVSATVQCLNVDFATL